MINNNEYLIILKDVDKTEEIHHFSFEKGRLVVYFSENGKSFPYLQYKYFTKPELVDISNAVVKVNGDNLSNDLNKVLLFENKNDTYYKLFLKTGRTITCRKSEIEFITSEENSSKGFSLLEYYKSISKLIEIKDENSSNYLCNQIDSIGKVDDKTVLTNFLRPNLKIRKYQPREYEIYPFGCNLSQMDAINNALTSSISIIEGPPGTGKTQTILNIIANLLMENKKILVVSNNNSATDNIYEKLDKYGLSFFVAKLGNSDRKKDFVENYQDKSIYLDKYLLDAEECQSLKIQLKQLKQEVMQLFELTNNVANLSNVYNSLEIEKEYFEEYYNSLNINNIRLFRNQRKLTTNKIFRLLDDFNNHSSSEMNKFWLKIKSVMFYGMYTKVFKEATVETITLNLQKLFYETKGIELKENIERIRSKLKDLNNTDKQDVLTSSSMSLLMNKLAKKYSSKEERKKFDIDDFYRNTESVIHEYPVILSSTHSARSSLKSQCYDYVIVDESSQVDLITGVLSMSCAKNIVIVGDLKQLPNVVKSDLKSRISKLSNEYCVPDIYKYEQNSLLSAMNQLFDSKIPKTLLKEHYRCHPKIINFCNKKFYNDELIIMTEDKSDKDVLGAFSTVAGNHARYHTNIREIDVIHKEAIRSLGSPILDIDLGIIAPYVDQVSEIIERIPSYSNISTVHKFQGRECKNIIISTVDNKIGDFVSNPNLLNVAVSRAIEKLRIVVSDNVIKEDNSNVGDLIRYIRYNNFEVKQSKINSVFDLLYECNKEERKKFLKGKALVSEYDSENLANTLFLEILQEEKYNSLKLTPFIALANIFNSKSVLDEKERDFVFKRSSHVDFIISRKLDSSIVLAIEIDGFSFHKKGSKQYNRDQVKNKIFEANGIKLIRFSSVELFDKNIVRNYLDEILTSDSIDEVLC